MPAQRRRIGWTRSKSVIHRPAMPRSRGLICDSRRGTSKHASWRAVGPHDRHLADEAFRRGSVSPATAAQPSEAPRRNTRVGSRFISAIELLFLTGPCSCLLELDDVLEGVGVLVLARLSETASRGRGHQKVCSYDYGKEASSFGSTLWGACPGSVSTPRRPPHRVCTRDGVAGARNC